jgi:hypothetical protein
MPTDAVNGRVEAFLGVPLYRSMFDNFRGTTLPPEVGLQNYFKQQFGILPDRVQQAVRVFKDSATQAGFFQSAPDRLIRPATASAATMSATADSAATPERREDAAPERGSRRSGGGGDDGYGIDPSILGLLRQLPKPGEPWSAQDQQAFLNAFTAVVKFIYPVKSEAGGA